MKESNRIITNEALSDYTDRNCAHLYASIRENGRLQLDGYFEIDEIKEIMRIISLNDVDIAV